MTWKSPYSRPGVYRITCLQTGKDYVGGTSNIYMRRANHLNRLKKGEHARRLQADWDRYGREAFEIEVLEFVDDPDDLHPAEQFWIEALSATDPRHGYNTVAAFVLPLPKRPRSGWTMSDEQKAKIAAAQRGRPMPDHVREALALGRAAAPPKPVSEMTRAKLSAANKGRKPTPEQREKMAAAKRGRRITQAHIEALAEGRRKARERRDAALPEPDG